MCGGKYPRAGQERRRWGVTHSLPRRHKCSVVRWLVHRHRTQTDRDECPFFSPPRPPSPSLSSLPPTSLVFRSYIKSCLLFLLQNPVVVSIVFFKYIPRLLLIYCCIATVSSPTSSDLRHMTSNVLLASPTKEHRSSNRAPHLLRTSDARLGSRSPNSIPSSPASVYAFNSKFCTIKNSWAD